MSQPDSSRPVSSIAEDDVASFRLQHYGSATPAAHSSISNQQQPEPRQYAPYSAMARIVPLDNERRRGSIQMRVPTALPEEEEASGTPNSASLSRLEAMAPTSGHSVRITTASLYDGPHYSLPSGKIQALHPQSAASLSNNYIIVNPVAPGYAPPPPLIPMNHLVIQEASAASDPVVASELKKWRVIAMCFSISSLVLTCLCCISLPAVVMAIKRPKYFSYNDGRSRTNKKDYIIAIVLSGIAYGLALMSAIVAIVAIDVLVKKDATRDHYDSTTHANNYS